MKSADRWQKIEAALDAALDVSPEERPELLERLCGEDQGLRREVEALLVAQSGTEDFLEIPAGSYVAPFVEEVDDPLPGEVAGTIVGRYRILHEIGRGGMGTVWLAERADGAFEQQVALKLVKRGMDTDEILARFLRERQILARLEHPNIARLLDGGVSEDGRPYFVMEHVAGLPITEHCDRRRLPIEERLRLFAVACRTVSHAHRNLVVHRDLKPSNVLVTEQGEVKLLDFGIAKLVSAEDDATVMTAGGAIMTPEYASPEQVAGGPVTTASDVYQLGVLLYELLTGHRAHALDGRSPTAIIRAVLEGEPPRPSTAVRKTETVVHRDGESETIEPASVSRRRGTTLERLQRRLRGDLDTIAMGALRKEPERRYPSAEALAEDVERHLADLPIHFGDDRFSYRAAKFARRHRLGVASAAGVLAVVVGLVSFYTLELRSERDRARLEADKATETALLLSGFFRSWNPDPTVRVEVSPDKAIGLAAQRAERELRNQPETLAATLSLLGDLQISLGQWAAADSLLSRAQAIQQRLHREPTADLAVTLARRGRFQLTRGEYDAAETTLRRALDLHRRFFGMRNPQTVRVQHDLAWLLHEKRNLTEAEGLFRGILLSMDETDRESSPRALETASMLGYILVEQTRFDDAVAILRPTLNRQRRMLGDSYATLVTLRHLGTALRESGELEEAEALYREALRISRAQYGEEHLEVTVSMIVLAIVLQREGEFDEAEALVRRAGSFYERHVGSEHFETANRWVHLAGILLENGDMGEAEPLLRRALLVFRRSFPAGHPEEGDLLNRLAYIVISRGAPDADSLYRRAVAFDDSRPAGSPAFISDGYDYLAWARHRKGDLAGAERNYRLALGLARRQLPHGHPERARTATGLGAVLLDAGRPAEAARYLREGLAEWQAHRPHDAQRLAEASALLEEALAATRS